LQENILSFDATSFNNKVSCFAGFTPEAGHASDICLSATVLPLAEFYLIGNFGEFPIK